MTQDLIGRILADRYRIEEAIGRGGMSVVYRGVDVRLGRPIALKVISFPAEIDDSARLELRERLRREAAAAARIYAHPHVVHIYDYGTDATLELDFIVMELLEGIDLKQAMKDSVVPPERALDIIRSAARGIAAGHRAGIIHRDVKPANIFLVEAGTMEIVKILDFGIAKALQSPEDEDLTRLDRAPHSPAYASPEQLDPALSVTAASDVYQLGLVAYELLAGERPFRPDSREGAPRISRSEIPQLGRWAQTDPGVRRVIERALEARPESRIPDAQRFIDELDGIGEDDDRTVLFNPSPAGPAIPEPERAAPHSPAPKQISGARKRRAPAAMVAAILAVLAVVWITLGRNPRATPDLPPASTVAEALDADFRPLIYQAAQNVSEAIPDN